MPLALIAIGTLLFVGAVRGTLTDSGDQKGLFTLLKNDFTGDGNFLLWVLAIGAVGAAGYVKPLKPIANAFIVLILIVFILAANKGGKDFFSSLLSQVTGKSITLGLPKIGAIK